MRQSLRGIAVALKSERRLCESEIGREMNHLKEEVSELFKNKEMDSYQRWFEKAYLDKAE